MGRTIMNKMMKMAATLALTGALMAGAGSAVAADRTRDQIKLKDGSCVAKLQIRDRLKDGSCVAKLQIRKRLKDGSCVARAGDRTKAQLKLKDGSCLL
jgi:hypothetical protein